MNSWELFGLFEGVFLLLIWAISQQAHDDHDNIQVAKKAGYFAIHVPESSETSGLTFDILNRWGEPQLAQFASMS